MNGLYKRGKIYWIACRINGKLYRESTKTDKRREAEYILACRKKEVKEGNIPEIKRMMGNVTFHELAKEYLVWAERQKSFDRKRFLIADIVNLFGNIKIDDLRPMVVEQLQSTKLKEGKKPATINRLVSCLKHMISKGFEWHMATENAVKEIRKVKQLKEDNKRLRYLTIEECQKLLDCCPYHLKQIVTVALHSGMRRGEILGLTWNQIDLQNGFILLDKTKSGFRREIPINSTLEMLFNSLSIGFDNDYLFTNKDGKPYSEIKHSFTTAVKKAGIHDFRFHDIRHTFASHLIMQGIGITSVKELLGHSDIKMTLRYAHLAPGYKRKAVNTLDKLMQNNADENFVHNLFTVPESQPTETSRK